MATKGEMLYEHLVTGALKNADEQMRAKFITSLGAGTMSDEFETLFYLNFNRSEYQQLKDAYLSANLRELKDAIRLESTEQTKDPQTNTSDESAKA